MYVPHCKMFNEMVEKDGEVVVGWGKTERKTEIKLSLTTRCEWMRRWRRRKKKKRHIKSIFNFKQAQQDTHHSSQCGWMNDEKWKKMKESKEVEWSAIMCNLRDRKRERERVSWSIMWQKITIILRT